MQGICSHSRRTQPPYFVQMIDDYFEHTADLNFLDRILKFADVELHWWETNRSVEIEDNRANKKLSYKMFQFRVREI